LLFWLRQTFLPVDVDPQKARPGPGNGITNLESK
jgi:hypothetical protein